MLRDLGDARELLRRCQLIRTEQAQLITADGESAVLVDERANLCHLGGDSSIKHRRIVDAGSRIPPRNLYAASVPGK